MCNKLVIHKFMSCEIFWYHMPPYSIEELVIDPRYVLVTPTSLTVSTLMHNHKVVRNGFVNCSLLCYVATGAAKEHGYFDEHGDFTEHMML